MPELRHPGPARAFRPSLRARMTLLYGAVICASGVALIGVTQLLAPGLLGHGVQKAGGPDLPGAVTAGPPTRVPPTIGPSAFWSIVVAFAIMAVLSVAAGWLVAAVTGAGAGAGRPPAQRRPGRAGASSRTPGRTGTRPR